MLDVSSILTLQSKVLFQHLSSLNLPYQKKIDIDLKIDSNHREVPKT